MPRTATLQEIPSGSAGTRATLRHMSRLVREFKKTLPIRDTALQIISDVPGHKNWVGQVRSIHAWVRDHVQYVRDISGVETLATPVQTLDYMQGDCDDQATLVAALLESIGHPTRFVAISASALGAFSHVYTETKIGHNPGKWIPLETTEKFSMGKPMRFARRMIENN